MANINGWSIEEREESRRQLTLINHADYGEKKLEIDRVVSGRGWRVPCAEKTPENLVERVF